MTKLEYMSIFLPVESKDCRERNFKIHFIFVKAVTHSGRRRYRIHEQCGTHPAPFSSLAKSPFLAILQVTLAMQPVGLTQGKTLTVPKHVLRPTWKRNLGILHTQSMDGLKGDVKDPDGHSIFVLKNLCLLGM